MNFMTCHIEHAQIVQGLVDELHDHLETMQDSLHYMKARLVSHAKSTFSYHYENTVCHLKCSC